MSPAWVSKLKLLIGKPSKMQMKKLKKSEFECTDEILVLPQEWQNTLVKNFPSLRRSSSSLSSCTTTSSSSNSSSYSVNDFLRDLAETERIYQKSITKKTSTPVSCNIVPLNRMRREEEVIGLTYGENNPNLSGMKIYDDEDVLFRLTQTRDLHHKDKKSEDENLYENGTFLRQQEIYNIEDIDDGYEIICISSNPSNNKKRLRTLKEINSDNLK